MIKAQTDNSDWKAPKTRKKRKPMSEEQKAAAAERLAIAREKKREENPNYGKSGIHESLWDLPDDHAISPKKVKEWIKTQRDIVSSERASERQNIKGARSRRLNAEAYIRDMNTYLRNGDWVSMFYGEHENHLVKYRCVAMAYDKDGNPKRDVGVWYPDIGTYTQEMFDEDKELSNERRKKRPNNKRPLEGSSEGKESKATKRRGKRKTTT